ncbi:AraC family transcriptional regulator [Dyadobacter sp. CY312]|uniref:helix-turn-helix domain-containing protein n=1 Tax=Dyadobacter sp. CY312 TaxID=2907303 RepID=UPI001F279296|nr:AraC family transcriptional regulator [Dyadobacter sp. CY312]MCE7040399.1 helix-turn-helix transcriptional regulator [Dyadobacter sp. CY312]
MINKPASLDEFYRATSAERKDGTADQGHFDVFRVKDLNGGSPDTLSMPYNRKIFYKITLINGNTEIKYGESIVNTGKKALLFTTPKVPFQYLHRCSDDSGYFCIFNPEFLLKYKGGSTPDEFPILRADHFPVVNLNAGQFRQAKFIFEKMYSEIPSDYIAKYDLLRTYLLELIHYGQKLQPRHIQTPTQNAAYRLSEMFFDLLERQFPIELLQQQVGLRAPNAYADKLSVHINHLNKTLKLITAKTTTELINERILREAKILLKHTDWSISQIAFSLGFDESSHFSKFFKKQTGIAPSPFRT